MPGCAFSVLVNSTSGPSKQILARSYLRASLAVLNNFSATGNLHDRSLPIPATCAPCPANNNAVFCIERADQIGFARLSRGKNLARSSAWKRPNTYAFEPYHVSRVVVLQPEIAYRGTLGLALGFVPLLACRKV